MTKEQFSSNISRLFQARGIDYMEFEKNSYADNDLRPYYPFNNAFVLCVYIEDGYVYVSSEREDGMLTHERVLDVQTNAEWETFFDTLCEDVYAYVSNEETDGTYEEFIS